MTHRDPRAGLVLINVLVLLALAATVLYLMLNLTDGAIARSQRFGEAGTVQALLHAGEISAVVALRRDMTDAPAIDHPLEPWGRVAQDRIDIKGGSFELRIEDARRLFNLNALPRLGPPGIETLRSICDALDLPPGLAKRIADSVALEGPLRDLDDLTTRVGLSETDVTSLASFAAALPGPGDMNINAVSPDLLAILLGDMATARALIARRDKVGFLTPDDLSQAGVTAPPGLGFQSDLFRIFVTARIGATEQSLTSLLQRGKGAGDRPEVAIVRRADLAALPPPPPDRAGPPP